MKTYAEPKWVLPPVQRTRLRSFSQKASSLTKAESNDYFSYHLFKISLLASTHAGGDYLDLCKAVLSS